MRLERLSPHEMPARSKERSTERNTLLPSLLPCPATSITRRNLPIAKNRRFFGQVYSEDAENAEKAQRLELGYRPEVPVVYCSTVFPRLRLGCRTGDDWTRRAGAPG